MTSALVASNVLLWLCVVGLAAVVLSLVRQIGVLHERLAPAGAMLTPESPRVGDAAPIVAATDLDGRDVRVGGPGADGSCQLLLFLSPTCPVCATVLPIVLDCARAETPPARVILASDGDDEEHRAYVRRHALAAVTYVVSTELGLTYRVGKLPHAVLIGPDGSVRAKGLVNTREHVESLFEANRYGVASIQDYLTRDRDEDAA